MRFFLFEEFNEDLFIVKIIKHGEKQYISRLNDHTTDGFDVTVTSKSPFRDPEVLKLDRETAQSLLNRNKNYIMTAVNIKGEELI